MYEVFEHTADLGIRVRAADLSTLFADAGRGLLAVIIGNAEAVQPAQEVAIRLEGRRTDFLLLDWLTELLYRFDTERLLLRDFDVRIGDHGLEATARGERLDPTRHHLEHEVKAVTYHGLKVERDDRGWLAEVILDI
jgi:SHS2 domain-containing protein